MANLMDDDLENAFSIDETMNIGKGDPTLLNDLISPETASSDPSDIEPIVNEVEDSEPTSKAKNVKPITPKGSNPDETETHQNFLSDFLSEDDSEDPKDGEDGEKPIDKKPDDSHDEGDEKEEVNSQFDELSKELHKLGVFTSNDEEEEVPITTGEEFLERFQSEKKKGAIELVNTFIGQFGEDYQNAFDAIYVKGVNPKDYFGVYNEIVNFSELDITQEENQVKVIRKGLTDQGYEPEETDAEIERLRNYGDLESVAARHHKVLVKKEVIKLQELEQQAAIENQRKLQIKSTYINNVQNIINEKLKSKEFDGIPINPQLANELQDYLLVDKWKAPSGELLTDFDRFILDMKKPENHAMKVKVALLFKILEKDPTLSTIQKRVASKKAETLFESVTKQSKGGKQPEPKRTSWFS